MTSPWANIWTWVLPNGKLDCYPYIQLSIKEVRKKELEEYHKNPFCKWISKYHSPTNTHCHYWIIMIFLIVSDRQRSKWSRGLRRMSVVARLLGLQVRIPPVAWMSVSCECGLSGCNCAASIMSRPCPNRNRFILTFIPFFVTVPPSQYLFINLK